MCRLNNDYHSIIMYYSNFKTKVIYTGIVLSLLILINSCTSRKHLAYLNTIEKDPTEREYSLQTLDHRLNVGDIIYVKIMSSNTDISTLFNPSDYGFNSYSQNSTSSASFLKGFMIDSDGNINLPIIKTIRIAGMTVAEAEHKVQQVVDENLNNTTLIFKLLSFNVNIMGEVRDPGTKEIYQARLNIFEALARAGDIRETGDKKNILILRTIGDTIITYTVDLTDDSILSSDKMVILPNDIIIVQPLRLQSFRMNLPAISVLFSAATTLMLAVNILYR